MSNLVKLARTRGRIPERVVESLDDRVASARLAQQDPVVDVVVRHVHDDACPSQQ